MTRSPHNPLSLLAFSHLAIIPLHFAIISLPWPCFHTNVVQDIIMLGSQPLVTCEARFGNIYALRGATLLDS